jgi:hypothetical protein
MMSSHRKIQVPVGILYSWTYPTVNPYSCGVDVCSLGCSWDGLLRYSSLTDLNKTGIWSVQSRRGLWPKVMDNVSIWTMVAVMNSRIKPTDASALNEEYNHGVTIAHRQSIGKEVHDARCPMALNSGC